MSVTTSETDWWAGFELGVYSYVGTAARVARRGLVGGREIVLERIVRFWWWSWDDGVSHAKTDIALKSRADRCGRGGIESVISP